MKKKFLPVIFFSTLAFSQIQTPYDNLNCGANDIIKEVYMDGNTTILKCTDTSGNFLLFPIPNTALGGSNGGGGNPVDTGLSIDPGQDWIPTTHCINTWFKVDGKWKIINYCGNP